MTTNSHRPNPDPDAGFCRTRLPLIVSAIVAAVVVTAHGQQTQQPPERPADEQGFRFRSGVELVNVTATVSDTSGRFVPGLRADDFLVYAIYIYILPT